MARILPHVNERGVFRVPSLLCCIRRLEMRDLFVPRSEDLNAREYGTAFFCHQTEASISGLPKFQIG